MNSLYQSMQQNSMQNQYSQFTQNPFQFIMQRQGINIPQQFQNDPHGAVQYLLNNGTMQQNAFNSYAQFCQRAGIRI